MHILLVSDHYPPFIGGAHRQTQLLGQELRRRGHAVSVVTSWQPGLPAQQDDGGICVHRLKEIRTWLPSFMRTEKQRYHPPYPDPFIVWQLRRLLGRLQPDVVHASGWFSYSCAVALLGKKVPLLISARDYGYSCATCTMVFHGQYVCAGPALPKCFGCAAELYGAPKGWIATAGVYLGRTLLRRQAGGLHSISSYMHQIMERDFLASRSARQRGMLHHDIPSFRETDEDENYSADPALKPYLERLPGQPFILFVGALRLAKGIQQLLTAYEQLAARPPLVLIGTIEPDTPRQMPPGVVILQDFPHRAVMAAWEHCLFGVLPSLLPEPLGSVVYEGMSRGIAIIGTKPGGHADMISDGESGLLVPSGDIPALRQAMQQLLDNPAFCEQLGQVARQRARKFTADVAVPRFVRFYEELTTAAG